VGSPKNGTVLVGVLLRIRLVLWGLHICLFSSTTVTACICTKLYNQGCPVVQYCNAPPSEGFEKSHLTWNHKSTHFTSRSVQIFPSARIQPSAVLWASLGHLPLGALHRYY